LLFDTIPRFSEQSFAEKVAAGESVQLSMRSLQSVENAALDNNMDLFNCDRTWLETAKEDVSSYLIICGVGLVLFILGLKLSL
jgi:hypothetical protein